MSMLIDNHCLDTLDLLDNQGLHFEFYQGLNIEKSIGFERLIPYLEPFWDSTDFENRLFARLPRYLGVSLQNVVELYQWDSKLRSLVLSAVEELEIWLRSELGHLLMRRHSHAHLLTEHLHGSLAVNLNREKPRTGHAEWVDKYRLRLSQHSRIPVIDLSDLEFGPDVMEAVQVMDFGLLARLARMLKFQDKEPLAFNFGARDTKQLDNWLAVTNYVRNMAAHQERLWDRELVINPSLRGLPESMLANLDQNIGRVRIAGAITILSRMLGFRPLPSDFQNALQSHLSEFPQSREGVSLQRMGFSFGLGSVTKCLEI